MMSYNSWTGYSINRETEPGNTAALLGNEVILHCHRYVDQSMHVTWHFYEIGKRSQEIGGRIVATFGTVLPKFNRTFSLNRSIDGQNDLVIRHVRLEDAGIYECVKTWNDRPSAHLTVIHGNSNGCLTRVLTRFNFFWWLDWSESFDSGLWTWLKLWRVLTWTWYGLDGLWLALGKTCYLGLRLVTWTCEMFQICLVHIRICM